MTLRMPHQSHGRLADSRWITIKELAHHLSVSQSFLFRLMNTDGLPHLKIGRALRFKVEEVSAWIDRRRRP